MTQTPLISVIVPAYNAEKYIAKCVESIRKNTYQNIEVIIVNDGSKDNTRQVAESISDSRVRLINQENGGVAKARNTGLERANGEYVAFVDSDDYISEDYFATLVAANSDIAACRHICVNDAGKLIRDPFPGITQEIDYTPEELAQGYFCLVTGVINSCCGKLYKRQIIGDNRFSETLRWGEDASFNLQCFQNMEYMRVLPNKNYFYVLHSGQATTGKIQGYGEMLLEYVANIHEFLTKYQAYDYAYIRRGMGSRCLSDFFTAATHANDLSEYKRIFDAFEKTPWYSYVQETSPKSRFWKAVRRLVLHRCRVCLYGMNKIFNFLVKVRRMLKICL